MATSSEQITDLISGYTDLKQYFEGARGSIEDRVQAAIAAAPDMHRRLFVDAISGDDGNVGNSDNPLATINKAIDLVPENGSGEIKLRSDIVLLATREPLGNKAITIDGENAGGNARITLTAYEINNQLWLSGWNSVGTASGMMLRHCEIEFPAYSGGLSERMNFSSLLGNIASFERALPIFSVRNCKLIAPAQDAYGYLATLSWNGLGFFSDNLTDVNGTMSGRFVENVDPANPQSHPQLITNMTSM